MIRLTLMLSIAITAAAADARSVRVKGYMRSNGTYQMPSIRTAPDARRYNNWSAKGNVNPYTGKAGTVDPWKPKPIGGR